MMCLLARIMCSQLLLLLLLSLSLCAVEAGQWTVRPRRTTTTPRSVTTTTTTTVDRHQHVHHWPPLVAPPFSQPEPSVPLEIRLIDSYDQRSPDGQSEFRYQLSNGDTRYERTYWLPVGKGRSVLARRGFFSVPLPSSLYSTVYYRADHQGYHVDTHTLSEEQPLLPRSLDVAPLDTMAGKSTAGAGEPAAAKRNSIGVPERNDSYEQRKESPRQSELREPRPDAAIDDDDDDDDAAAVDDYNHDVHVDDQASRARVRVRGRYPSKVKVHAELEQPTVNETFTKPSASASTVAKDDDNDNEKESENILASQVGTETEELPDDDDDVSASSQSSIRLN